MRKYLIAAGLWLVACSLALAQLTMLQSGSPRSTGFAASCSQTTSFIARTSGLTNAQKTNYNNLICGLETDAVGCSSKLDALYILAAPDATTKLLNLCSASFALVQSGVCTFTANQGVACDGGTGHLDTQFSPLSSGSFYTQNAASYGAYNRSNGSPSRFFGTRNGADNADSFLDFGGGNVNGRINEGIGAAATAGVGNSSGIYLMSRTGAGATKIYHYGVDGLPVSATGTGASSATVGNSFWIGCTNLDGSCSGASTDQVAGAFIGGSLNDTQAGNLQSRINTFMTAVGANVY